MQNGQWKLQIGNGCLLETRFTFFVLRVAKCNDNFFFNLLAQYGLSGVKQCIENQKFFHGYFFQGGGPTIVLVDVVVESEDSRIWHGFVGCRVLSMTLMYCIYLIFSLGSPVVMLLLATSLLSMGMITRKATILPTTSMVRGQHL
jgi:hypothetical protein